MSEKCGCSVVPYFTPGTDDNAEYRVSYCPLHAAAPKLLEACKLANNFFGDIGAGPEHWAVEKVREAIAAATEGR